MVSLPHKISGHTNKGLPNTVSKDFHCIVLGTLRNDRSLDRPAGAGVRHIRVPYDADLVDFCGCIEGKAEPLGQ